MNWVIVALVLSFALVLYLWRQRFHRRAGAALEYHFEFDRDEVFAGETFYLDQVVINISGREIPFLQFETMLPEGLLLLLPVEEGEPRRARSVENICTLKARQQISRRWRVFAATRGHYTAEQVQLHWITNDPLGMDAISGKLEPQPSPKSTLLVLPLPRDHFESLALSPTYTGSRTVPQGLVHDPMTVCGVRDYEAHDPLNTVDWKQTARLGHMVVRKTETQQDDRYNVLLSMQSALVEKNMPYISVPQITEIGISTTASLLESLMSRNIPTRLLVNTDPDGMNGRSVRPEGVGRQIFQSEEFRNRDETLQAFRVLARLPLTMSVTVETLMDEVLAHPEDYVRGGNLVMVSAFLNARMVHFHRLMKEQGYRVVFFVATGYNNALSIPGDVEVYFRIK